MRLSADRIADALARSLAPLYVLIGDEPLGLTEAGDAIRAAARAAGHTERCVHVFAGRMSWEPIFVTGESRSLFAERKLIEIRVPSGKPGVDGSKALQTYAERLPADTLTLLELPGIEFKQTQTKWFGALERAGVVVEAKPVERRALPDWIARRLSQLGLKAERSALAFLADRVEGNLLAARQEIEKLALLFAPGQPITLADIEAAVTDLSRLDVETLPDAWLEGDLARFVRVVNDLRDSGEAIPAFQWQLTAAANVLYRLKSAQGQGGAGDFARSLWGRDRQRLPLYERAAARLTLAQIEAGVLGLAALDSTAKGLVPAVDPWDALIRLGHAWAAPARRLHP